MEEIVAVFELLSMLAYEPRTAVLIVLLLIAAVIDYRTFKIPNWLTMGGAAFALVYSVVVPFSPQQGLLWAFGGLVVGLLIMLPLHVMKVMGAGDVKLMAMSGAFLGFSGTFSAVVCTFIVGGAAALGFAMYHGVLGRMLGNIKTTSSNMMFTAIAGVRPDVSMKTSNSVGKLPYGVSIAAGTIGYIVARQLGYL